MHEHIKRLKDKKKLFKNRYVRNGGKTAAKLILLFYSNTIYGSRRLCEAITRIDCQLSHVSTPVLSVCMRVFDVYVGHPVL
jgi:hypothetical protein